MVWKLENVATRYANSGTAFSRAVLASEGDTGEQLALSIYLDSVVVYFRVIADAIAAITPYYYAESLGAIASRSFRDHRKWFCETCPTADPDYATILREHTAWFEDLAGKDERGIRDLLIHRFGRFQHPVTTAPVHLQGRVSADLIAAGRYDSSVDVTLARAMAGFCRFLDVYTVHQSDRINSEAGWTILDPTSAWAGDMFHFDQVPASKWLFPLSGP